MPCMVASHGMVMVCVAHGDASSVYSQLMIKIVEVASTMYHTCSNSIQITLLRKLCQCFIVKL